MITSETFCCEEAQKWNQMEEGEQNGKSAENATLFVDLDEEHVKMQTIESLQSSEVKAVNVDQNDEEGLEECRYSCLK